MLFCQDKLVSLELKCGNVYLHISACQHTCCYCQIIELLIQVLSNNINLLHHYKWTPISTCNYAIMSWNISAANCRNSKSAREITSPHFWVLKRTMKVTELKELHFPSILADELIPACFVESTASCWFQLALLGEEKQHSCCQEAIR